MTTPSVNVLTVLCETNLVCLTSTCLRETEIGQGISRECFIKYTIFLQTAMLSEWTTDICMSRIFRTFSRIPRLFSLILSNDGIVIIISWICLWISLRKFMSNILWQHEYSLLESPWWLWSFEFCHYLCYLIFAFVVTPTRRVSSYFTQLMSPWLD